MKKVLYIQPIHESGMKRLADKYEVVVAPDTERETLLQCVADADAVVTRLTYVDREMMEAGKNLRAVAKHGVGIDNIDVEAAKERGIAVLTTGDANSLSVAEHAFFAIGALYKKIVRLDQEMRKGNWQFRDKAGAADVTGKTLGLIGLGKIGKNVARMASQGFSMEILVFDPYLSKDQVAAMGYEKVENLDQFCERCDVLSIHIPLTESSRDLIDERRLALMKPGAFLVNFARGGIVNEEALYRALKERKIAGAALDAFESEPPDREDPLLQLDNVILSPHCATFTEESKIRMSMQLAEDIENVLEGRTPKFPAFL